MCIVHFSLNQGALDLELIFCSNLLRWRQILRATLVLAFARCSMMVWSCCHNEYCCIRRNIRLRLRQVGSTSWLCYVCMWLLFVFGVRENLCTKRQFLKMLAPWEKVRDMGCQPSSAAHNTVTTTFIQPIIVPIEPTHCKCITNWPESWVLWERLTPSGEICMDRNQCLRLEMAIDIVTFHGNIEPNCRHACVHRNNVEVTL